MPHARICTYDGCPEYQPCPTHKPLRSPSSRRTSEAGYKRARREAFKRYGDICHICGLPGAEVADHVVPAAHGGSNDQLKPAHASCNRRKSDFHGI